MYKIQRLKNIYVVICCCCLVTVWLFRNPMDYSPPCSLARGIFQAKILEWVAVSFSSESFRPRNQTQVSCISYNGRWVLYPLSHQESPVYSYSFVCVCPTTPGQLCLLYVCVRTRGGMTSGEVLRLLPLTCPGTINIAATMGTCEKREDLRSRLSWWGWKGGALSSLPFPGDESLQALTLHPQASEQ